MAELKNCPTCNGIFVKNQFRDVCEACWKEEEKAYETVYQYMRKRENRAATMTQVIEATGIEEDLLLKFIRNGRIKITQFPNLGYPCDKCGAIIREGKLCARCLGELKKDLQEHTQVEELRKNFQKSEKHATYFLKEDKYRK